LELSYIGTLRLLYPLNYENKWTYDVYVLIYSNMSLYFGDFTTPMSKQRLNIPEIRNIHRQIGGPLYHIEQYGGEKPMRRAKKGIPMPRNGNP